jgi:hypothetical protein
MAVDVANVSDAEFLALSDDAFKESEAEPTSEPEDSSQEDLQATEDEGSADENEDLDHDDDEDLDTGTDPEDLDEPASDAADHDADTDQDTEDKTDVDAPTNDVDFKSEYDRLLAPFNANGTQMQVKNVDEAISLMQMGANYSKKMSALKPGLKTLKLLQTHDLLEPEKVSLMIDAAKGDKAAITRLMKQSGIDPLDVDPKAESDYTPTQYTVDDNEMAFDEVMEDNRNLPHFSEAVDVVVTEWDDSSKKTVASNPKILSDIRTHMESGIYPLIKSEMQRRRLLGGLGNTSDLVAYKQVGDDLNAAGKFDHLFAGDKDTNNQRKVITKPVVKSADPDIKKRKRAASPSRSGKNTDAPNPSAFDPLGMSDEEFLTKFGN